MNLNILLHTVELALDSRTRVSKCIVGAEGLDAQVRGGARRARRVQAENRELRGPPGDARARARPPN